MTRVDRGTAGRHGVRARTPRRIGTFAICTRKHCKPFRNQSGPSPGNMRSLRRARGNRRPALNSPWIDDACRLPGPRKMPAFGDRDDGVEGPERVGSVSSSPWVAVVRRVVFPISRCRRLPTAAVLRNQPLAPRSRSGRYDSNVAETVSSGRGRDRPDTLQSRRCGADIAKRPARPTPDAGARPHTSFIDAGMSRCS